MNWLQALDEMKKGKVMVSPTGTLHKLVGTVLFIINKNDNEVSETILGGSDINGEWSEKPKGYNSDALSIWKREERRDSFAVKIKELDVIINVYKDNQPKSYEKIEKLLQG